MFRGVVDTMGGTRLESRRGAAVRTGSAPWLVPLFTAASFVSAFLLFLVQPLVAKQLLPSFGGSPAVWNTAMVFFQATLLGGYLYAHASSRRGSPRRQLAVHVAVVALPLAVLPLTLPDWAAPPDGQAPALWLLLVLVVSVGAPFLALSTTGPLLQRWFSLTGHPRSADPYFLYAASNVGSFLALVAYPFVLEPVLDLDDQARAWSAGYVAFVVLVLGCGAVVLGRRWPAAAPGAVETAEAPALEEAPPDRRRQLRWLGLAFVPSSLMLGVTSHISTDLAAVPLLWVLPLGLYLLTFVLAFGPGADRRPARAAAALVGFGVAATLTMVGAVDVPLVIGIAVNLAFFAAAAFVAHRLLANDRPAPAHLTRFYLVVAAGGVLGGVFNALLAPVVFDHVVEYPLIASIALGLAAAGHQGGPLARRYGRLGLGAEALLIPLVALAAHRVALAGAVSVVVLFAIGFAAATIPRLRAAVAVGCALVAVGTVLAPDGSLHAERTFFGVYRVEQHGDLVTLVHGTTIHGMESLDPMLRDEPLSYYHRGSPIAGLFDAYADAPSFDEVGVVGLGVGTLATYGEPGDHFTFYEIDPAVVRIAEDQRWFHHLADTQAQVDIVVGDGRLELAAAAPGTFDLLVLDAFSSDAVPVHLLTREAVDLYRNRLAPGGVLAFHISNKNLDLRPVLAAIADDLGLAARVRRDMTGSDLEGTTGSWWLVMAENDDKLAELDADDRWATTGGLPRHLWTDARSDILSVLGVGDEG